MWSKLHLIKTPYDVIAFSRQTDDPILKNAVAMIGIWGSAAARTREEEVLVLGHDLKSVPGPNPEETREHHYLEVKRAIAACRQPFDVLRLATAAVNAETRNFIYREGTKRTEPGFAKVIRQVLNIHE